MLSFKTATWPEIQALRASIDGATKQTHSLQEAGQTFAELVAGAFDSCVLARVFALIPFERLPRDDQAWATTFANSIDCADQVRSQTPMLTLLGTAGIERDWNLRTRSHGHRAIPLADKGFVDSAPMIAALFAALRIDPSERASSGDVQIRSMAGGLNARFFVADAETAMNADDQHIIVSREFVAEHAIKSVFGMGGTYVDGTTAIAIIFTNETLAAADADRFTSFISTFKLATTESIDQGQLFPGER